MNPSNRTLIQTKLEDEINLLSTKENELLNDLASVREEQTKLSGILNDFSQLGSAATTPTVAPVPPAPAPAVAKPVLNGALQQSIYNTVESAGRWVTRKYVEREIRKSTKNRWKDITVSTELSKMASAGIFQKKPHTVRGKKTRKMAYKV